MSRLTRDGWAGATWLLIAATALWWALSWV